MTNPLTEATDNGGEVIMRNLTEPDCRVSLEVRIIKYMYTCCILKFLDIGLAEPSRT